MAFVLFTYEIHYPGLCAVLGWLSGTVHLIPTDPWTPLRRTVMKIGDWAFFKTLNWPQGLRTKHADFATGETDGTSDQRIYQGRGKIVGMSRGKIKVRDERTSRVVEIGPHPEDVIRPLSFTDSTLTLGDLRAFLEKYEDAPDDIPVTIALPLDFLGDQEEIPPDYLERKAVSAYQWVAASGIALMAYSESGEMAEGYLTPDERDWEGWDFAIELMPNDAQCFEAMRERESE